MNIGFSAQYYLFLAKKHHYSLPPVPSTHSFQRGHPDAASNTGIAAYTMKPLVKTDLVNTVRRVLDKSKGSTR